MSAPKVHTKELEAVSLLRPRAELFRLDYAPFCAIHISFCIKLALHAVREQWDDVTFTSYLLMGSAFAHVLLFLFTHWSVSVASFVRCLPVQTVEQAELIKVTPAKFSGSSEIVPLEKRTLKDGSVETTELSFEFRRQRFVYQPSINSFEKLKYPVKETFEYYSKSSGMGSDAKLVGTLEKYGLNKFEVPVPAFLTLLKEHMLAPFFVFQVFCVLLWCLDEYWYYSLFTLFMLITFECTVVGQRQRSLRELRSLQTTKQGVHVYRCGKWEQLPGEALVPGDIISIGRPTGPGSEEKVVPADCLLLGGSCIVEEAVLTGESTPQWKISISEVDNPRAPLNMKQDKQHLLFGGTRILQHTPDKNAKIRTPDGGTLAVVLRTGFETSQGRLMRTILFSTERVTANSLETGLFILFLLIFALAAAYYVLKHGLEDPSRSRFKLLLNCVMIITSVIPPELPMELSIAVNTSLAALLRKRVFCTEPFRIPWAGKVEVCCFDKTGTLTSDHMLLEGVATCDTAATAATSKPSKEQLEAAAAAPGGNVVGEAGFVTDLRQLPTRVAEVLATCHALVQVNDEVVGDPLEKAALQAVNWSFANDVALSPDRSIKVTLLHRYHFSSALKRMAALVRIESEDDTAPTIGVVIKGAPEVIKNMLASPPTNYDATYKWYASQGARVICLAYRTLGRDLDMASIKNITREQVECDLEFGGFAIFQCPLKDDSEAALKVLRDSSHQLMMITGDAPLTACYAASKVHIVTRPVLVLSHKEEDKGHGLGHNKISERREADDEYVWVSPDEQTQLPFSREWRDLLQAASEYDLCVTGDALAYVENIGVAQSLIPLCQVFARVSPEQKELVLKALRTLGRVTMMCGDGTNDVGALKAAHVGVALLAPSEIAEKIRKLKAAQARNKGRPSEAMQAVPGAISVRAAARAAAAARKTPGSALLEEYERQGKPVPPALKKMAAWLDELEASNADGQMPMLKPGDASMASPFTAKSSGVMPCTDIIKQGRCTLVTTVQMFKILGLLCLSTAYSLSVMYLQGVKLSDVQATCTGMLTAAMFFFISNSKPLDQLSATRPHPNIFTPYFFLSLLGQFAVHLSFLVYMYRAALALMPEDERLTSESDFKPNLVNSVCYIVETYVQVLTFAVNYVGHPFNTSIRDNRGLYLCLFYSSTFLVVVTLDIIPNLGSHFGLVELPAHLKWQMVAGGLAAVVINATWERLLRAALPARTPPDKGYKMYLKELAGRQGTRAKSD